MLWKDREYDKNDMYMGMYVSYTWVWHVICICICMYTIRGIGIKGYIEMFMYIDEMIER